MEVLVRAYRARRPNGQSVVVHEHWDFIDTSPTFSGTGFLPAGKRLALPGGEAVRQLDEMTMQIVATGEMLRDPHPVSTFAR